MNKQRIHDADTDFLALFPDRLSNPVMLLEGKKQQVAKRSEQAQELFAPECFAHPQQAAEEMVKLISRSSMVSMFEKPRLQWRARGGHPVPRINDLRHTFTCRNVERWYTQGLDIDCHILALSTYLGHAKITDTYWYLTATPELLAKAAQRLEHLRGGDL